MRCDRRAGTRLRLGGGRPPCSEPVNKGLHAPAERGVRQPSARGVHVVVDIARLRHAGVDLSLPRGETPGLAIALGGAGVSLRDLVRLYTGLANRGLSTEISDRPGPRSAAALLDPRAAWQVADMLAGVAPPEGASQRGIAYKTGTSYGYRDAWSVGFDGRHVLGVWVGRPDGAAVDADGCYWICSNDAGLIHRFTPDGRLDRSLAVPVKKPTMCAFGGSRLDTLFVTSIRPGGDLSDQPLAGGVFALNPGVTGLEEPAFN